MKTGLGICPRMVVYGPLARGDTPHPTPFGKRPNCLRDCFWNSSHNTKSGFLQFSPPFPSLPPRASSRGSGQGAKVCPAQNKYIHSGAANSLLLQQARKQAKQLKMDGKFPKKTSPNLN